MVKGLDIFRNHFRDYHDQYIIIGGTACDLIFSDAGLAFRATRDIDMVLCLETQADQFFTRFRSFITAGKYSHQQNSDGRNQYFRFMNPQNTDFPSMIELFSRKPDLQLYDTSHVIRIPAGPEISGLSAILLDDEYYSMIRKGKRVINGISITGAESLIPLKAKAYLDLLDRKNRGDIIDSKTMKKHRNDVFRLFRVLEPARRIILPDSIRSDMSLFMQKMKDLTISPKKLELGDISFDDLINELNNFFQIM